MTVIQGLFTAVAAIASVFMVGIVFSLSGHIQHYGLQSTLHDPNSIILIAALGVVLLAPLPFTVSAMMRGKQSKAQ